MQHPRHVAIIMDGNGRWAKRRYLPRFAGHQQSIESVRTIIKACIDKHIPVLTLFAFSSENWQRPEQEVSFLMALFLQVLEQEIQKLHENQVRLRVIGDITAFSSKLQSAIKQAERLTQHNTGLYLNIAANYGGRWDIVQAVKKIGMAIQNQSLSISDLDEAAFDHYTCLSECGPPDFFIRTSGEQRISNFLLWQLAYCELYFTETLWPDFRLAEFEEALCDFAQRERRYGRVLEEEVYA
jgi:undecaprenyl diphosphate synthase